jgi:hypothetical protein
VEDGGADGGEDPGRGVKTLLGILFSVLLTNASLAGPALHLSVPKTTFGVDQYLPVTMTIDPVQPTDTRVDLFCLDDRIYAPSYYVVPAHQSSVVGMIRGVHAGATTLYGEAGDSVTTIDLTVIQLPKVFFTGDRHFKMGTDGTTTLTIDTPLETDATFTLTQTTPGIVSIPASVTIPAHAASVSFTSHAVKYGTTDVWAEPPTDDIIRNGVGYFIDPLQFGFTNRPPTRPVERTSMTLGVYVETAQPVPVPVTITNDTPSLISAPSNVTIAAGQTTASFTVDFLAEGRPEIGVRAPSVSPQGSVASFFVDPGAFPHLGINAAPTMQAEWPSTVTISNRPLMTQPLVVTLASSNPAVLALPATATIPANASSIDLRVTPLAAGTVTITASAPGGIDGTFNITVQPAPATPSLIVTPLAKTRVGETHFLTLGLTKAFSDAVTVSLAQPEGVVAAIPPSVVIPAGATSATVPVTGTKIGGATVQLSATGGIPPSYFALFIYAPDLTLTAPESVPANSNATLRLTIDPVQSESTLVRFTSFSSSVVPPESLTIPANSASIDVPIETHGVGSARVIANAFNSLAGTHVDVNVVTPPAPPAGRRRPAGH